MTDLTNLLAVKERHEKALLLLPNVTAVGIGTKATNGYPTSTICIVVSVTKKILPERLKPESLIPAEIEGAPTDVVEVGLLAALARSASQAIYCK